METYAIEDHLPAFIGRFNEIEERQKDNMWILKPSNMARSIDTWVTDNMDLIIRQMETGPKIAQKYILNPCTVNNRKFDLRYIVNLKSVLPLEAYVYDDFQIRVSNKEYKVSRDNLNDFETHFTLMDDGVGPKSSKEWPQFLEDFEREHPGKWAEVVEPQINAYFAKVLKAF